MIKIRRGSNKWRNFIVAVTATMLLSAATLMIGLQRAQMAIA
jgi:hypothetical protein